MQVGLSTASFFPQLEVLPALEVLGSLHAPVCEVFLNAASQYTPRFARECRKRAQDAGMVIHSIHAMASQYEPQLFSQLPSQRQDAFDTLRRVLEAGAAMGARYHTFHGQLYYYNRPPGPTDYAFLAERTAQLLAVYREYGLGLSWENVHYGSFHLPEFARLLPQALSQTDGLGFCLDTKQALLGGDPPLEFAQTMANRLTHLHLCDVAGQKPCLPGRGQCDFAALANLLAQAHCDLPAMIEVYAACFDTPAQLGQAMAAMQRLFDAAVPQ